MAKQSVYRKRYKIRKVGSGGYEFCVPKMILERAADKEGISLDEFLAKFEVVHLFNDFDNVAAMYRFDPIKDDSEQVEIPEV